MAQTLDRLTAARYGVGAVIDLSPEAQVVVDLNNAAMYRTYLWHPTLLNSNQTKESRASSVSASPMLQNNADANTYIQAARVNSSTFQNPRKQHQQSTATVSIFAALSRISSTFLTNGPRTKNGLTFNFQPVADSSRFRPSFLTSAKKRWCPSTLSCTLGVNTRDTTSRGLCRPLLPS